MLASRQDVNPLADLDATGLTAFWAAEPLLGNSPFVILYGPSVKENSTQNSSRVQAHVFSIGGHQSFPRLTIAPAAPLYVAVQHLPHDLQGDEICRGLAVGLLSYFCALSEQTKTTLRDIAAGRAPGGSIPTMFDEMHAAQLAADMVEDPNPLDIFNFLKSAFYAKGSSTIDVDMLLPPNSMQWATDGTADNILVDDNGLPRIDYGTLNQFIEQFGPSCFLPTRKMKRAPSRPTASNKLKSLSSHGKLSVRKEMRELVDTESNYVGKLQSLANTIGPLFAGACTQELHRKLFPRSLREILSLHQAFHAQVRSILESTEITASKEIESGETTTSAFTRHRDQNDNEDALGIAAFSRLLLQTCPQLRLPYQDYIRTSKEFSTSVSTLLENEHAELYQLVQEVGEQYLRSVLIEPVQRLPRYSLFIDGILQHLPFAHPARQALLKTRDSIGKICEVNDSSVGSAFSTDLGLSRIVTNWPAGLAGLGRLALATDAVELQTPYGMDQVGSHLIILLFPGRLVILRKLHQGAMSALALMAEIDHHSTSKSSTLQKSALETGLVFAQEYLMSETSMLESSDGQLVDLTSLPPSALSHEFLNSETRSVSLLAPFQGRASKLLEEAARLRIEGRHSNELRESQRWSLRHLKPEGEQTGIFIAITERKTKPTLKDQYSLGAIRIFVQQGHDHSVLPMDSAGARLVAHVHLENAADVQIQMENSSGTTSSRRCKLYETIHVLRKMLRTLLSADDTWNVHRSIAFAWRALDALPLACLGDESKLKANRPKSPVKMLSNMLGAVTSQASTPLKARNRATTPERQGKSMSTPSQQNTRPKTQYQAGAPAVTKQSSRALDTSEHLDASITSLEETLAAYVVALRSRSGNVVGKILQARGSADELVINELYNSLLEDPHRLDIAAVVSVDVLFAAFEKFNRVAWADKMGPVMSSAMISDLKHSVGTQDVRTFREHFKRSLDEMSPQNRRAFAANLRLLADLLDAAGNDGDRGILIASFAEALVWTGNPHDCIMLFDRLTEDYDTFFEDVLTANAQPESSESSRSKRAQTSSVNSNTSSFRRRLGLTNLLQGSQADNEEPDSKVSSIWRSLSKTGRNLGENARFPTGSVTSLVRSRSTDNDVRIVTASRPGSRDRPTTAESGHTSASSSRPQSSYSSTSKKPIQPDLKVVKAPSVLRKKRRSSLSDLQSLRELDSSPSLRFTENEDRTRGHERNYPQAKISQPDASRHVSRLSPQRSGIPRFRSPENKENTPHSRGSPVKSKFNATEGVTITTNAQNNPRTHFSQLPTARSGLSERQWPPNQNTIPPHSDLKSTPRSRLQSPQKMGQRAAPKPQQDNSSNAELQAELLKIGEELSSLSRPGSSGNSAAQTPSRFQEMQTLSQRLDSLQQQLHNLNHGNGKATARSSASNDSLALEEKLKAAETKVCKLDELYQEANAENEALYDRFNDELGKIAGRVRKGEGIGELKARLVEEQLSARTLRAENARLKREIVEWKSMARGGS